MSRGGRVSGFIARWTLPNPGFWIVVIPIILAWLDAVGYWGPPKPFLSSYLASGLLGLGFLSYFTVSLIGIAVWICYVIPSLIWRRRKQ